MLSITPQVFYKWRWRANPPPKPPSWRTSVLLPVWFFIFDLSSKGEPSYAIAGTALRILRTHKPLHPMHTFGKMKAFFGGEE